MNKKKSTDITKQNLPKIDSCIYTESQAKSFCFCYSTETLNKSKNSSTKKYYRFQDVLQAWLLKNGHAATKMFQNFP